MRKSKDLKQKKKKFDLVNDAMPPFDDDDQYYYDMSDEEKFGYILIVLKKALNTSNYQNEVIKELTERVLEINHELTRMRKGRV